MASKNPVESFLSVLLFGLIGTCIGIIIAPNKGKETRKKLRILFEDIDEKAKDWLEESNLPR